MTWKRSVLLLPLLLSAAAAFAPSPVIRTQVRHAQSPPVARVSPTQLSVGGGAQMLEAASQNTQNIMSSPLFEYFVQALISNGVPTFFVLITLGFVFSRISKMSSREESVDEDTVIGELYQDLYGNANRKGGFGSFQPPGGKKKIKNLGVPNNEYLKITNINQIYDSYDYSLTAATKSKASAASSFRSKAFDRAFKLVMNEGGEDLPTYVKANLLMAEKSFLKKGSKLLIQMQSLQRSLAQQAIDKEIESMGIELSLDPNPLNETQAEMKANETKKNSDGIDLSTLSIKNKDASKSQALQEVSKLQRELMQLELNFVAAVVGAVGPERALGVRTALLGDIAARGTGALLTQLQDRPLSAALEGMTSKPKNIFVAKFLGDTTASQVSNLREEVTAIIRNANEGDEVLLVVQTGGGTVTGYGLAAAQLLRLKEANLKLTIAVEQVAASGGYLMSCMADHIVASPFAVLGSIGVISDIPNVYERLKKEGIEFQTVTAGKYKRTITPTKKVTKEDLAKSTEDVEEILVLFRDFVKENRPQLDIDKVATGETWFGTAALEKGLCDEIKTVDEVISEFVDAGCNVFEVEYSKPPEIGRLPFAFAQGESDGQGVGGMLRRSIRWAVRTIADEVRSEIGNISQSDSAERRYMARDDTIDRTFFK